MTKRKPTVAVDAKDYDTFVTLAKAIYHSHVYHIEGRVDIIIPEEGNARDVWDLAYHLYNHFDEE